MERRLKERLTGAAVLVMLAVIFIPMILDNSSDPINRITETNIPPRPDTDFRSRISSQQDVPAIVELQDTEGGPQAGSADDMIVETESASTQGSLPVPTPSAAAAAPAPETGSDDDTSADAWVVQLGSFSSESNANSLITELQGQGYRAYIEEIRGDSGIIYRVRVGPELSKADAEKTLAGLAEKFQLQGMILRYP